MVATRGWADVSTITAVDLACRFNDAGVASILFTDVGRDGLLQGANIKATVHLARKTNMPVIARRGVADLGDLLALARSHAEVLEGVITGPPISPCRSQLPHSLVLTVPICIVSLFTFIL